MPKLYMFYLGGDSKYSNIELHDVQFAIVNTPEEAFTELKARWFGELDSFHIDGYLIVDWVDGYDIVLTKESVINPPLQLYFVNLGGYRPDQLAEQYNVFYRIARLESGH